MLYVIIVQGIVMLFLVLYILLLSIPVCSGGDLISNGCGKVLFPWVKKFKLPSGKYCCKDCYMADLQTFSDLRKDKNIDDKI